MCYDQLQSMQQTTYSTLNICHRRETVSIVNTHWVSVAVIQLLSQPLHSEIHWLDIPQRVRYKLDVRIHRCLQNKAPQYPMDCCTRTSDVSSRQHLRSANRRQLMIPRHRRSTFCRRAFSVAGPMEWNSLPRSLRDVARSTDGFKSALKTHLFALQALRDAL